MSKNGLPTRGPRHMNGAAALFAQGRDLSHLAAAQRLAAPRVVNVGSDPEAFKRAAVALYQVACIQDAMVQLAKQLEALPEGHDVRTACERMLQTLADVLKAAETVPTK